MIKSQTFPRTNSLTGRALVRLLEGRKFTHRDFQRETASYRLSSNIEQLRNRHNWPIKSISETGETLDPAGRKATYSRYFFDQDDLLDVWAKVGAQRINSFIRSVKKFEKKDAKK